MIRTNIAVAGVLGVLVSLLAGCGDDSVGGYSAAEVARAQGSCENVIANACDYFISCGLLESGQRSACIVESRSVLGCARAVDTGVAYQACINELQGGSCAPAEQGALPNICTGVILLGQ